ncbi:hypothetical protein [Syntrophomonas curvata]
MFGLNEALMSFIRRQVGLRTDAASASGSLHAKVKEARDNILADTLAIRNLIGSPSHSRANNTVMGWLASPIKSIQRGVINISTSGYSATATISSVNPAKSIINYLGYTGNEEVRLELTNSTTVTAYRGGSNIVTVGYEVIEFY